MDETARQVKAAGGQFIGLKADVRDPAAANRVGERAVSSFGKVDFLLANAGIFEMNPLTTMTDQMFDDVVRTNLYGVFNVARAVLPSMIENVFGHIVATSSLAGRQGLANMGHYCASKWGVIGLTKALAREVGRHGITVNSVCQSAVNRPLTSNLTRWRQALPDDPAPTREKYEAARLASPSGVQSVPWVEPEEVTDFILFLLSNEGLHTTGSAYDTTAGASTSSMA